jgi:hypothetical protein
MKDRARSTFLVLAFIAACGQPAPRPPGPPPQWSVPEPPGHGDFARGSFRTPLSLEDAEQILLRTKVFEYGNMPPKRQVQAFNLLLDQPDAGRRFAAIGARGDTAGQLYALCGFLALKADAATMLASDLEARQGWTLVQDSDVILGSKTAAEVVAIIRMRRLWDEMRRAKEETAKYFEKAG